jgi:hypothetical protein
VTGTRAGVAQASRRGGRMGRMAAYAISEAEIYDEHRRLLFVAGVA